MPAYKKPTTHRSYFHGKGATRSPWSGPRGGEDEYTVRYCYTCGCPTDHDVGSKRCVNHPGW